MTLPDPEAGGAIPPTAYEQPAAAAGHLARQGVELGFGRSLAISASLHAAAIGCSLLVAFGVAPGIRSPGPQAHLVFAEAPQDRDWRLDEPERETSDVEVPEDPPAELVPVEEQPSPEPFQPDPAPSEVPLEPTFWTRVGPEPLEDLREREAERRRLEALAAVPPPAAPAPAAPAAPRGESRPLRLVDAPRPAYPRISLRLEEHGAVLLRIHVGADGHVVDVDLLESSGFDRLDQAALQAVRRWRFDPELRDGEAVAGVLDHRVVFVLEEPGYQ